MKRSLKRELGSPKHGGPDSRFFIALFLFALAGCSSLFKTRPVQEMSNTSAAIKAAKEVQADILAPVLYRKANEWFSKAKDQYKFKNFELAEEYAVKARKLAEQAEFEVLKNPGATRVEPASEASPEPVHTQAYDYPSPTPTPYEHAISAPQATSSPEPQP